MAHKILICKSCENIFPMYQNRSADSKFACPKCGSGSVSNVFYHFKP